MKEITKKITMKKRFIFACILCAVIVAAVVLFCIFNSRNAYKNVTAELNETYASIAVNKNTSADEVGESLSGYEKNESEDEKGNKTITYSSQDDTITIKTDASGKITYKSYSKNFNKNEQSTISGFNEEQIKIGMAEEDVLKCFNHENYVYNVVTSENGKPLEIYYYGWMGGEQQAMVQLVFKDGVLSYYTINNPDFLEKSELPDYD